MEVVRKILAYLSFKKQENVPEGSEGFNLRAMHVINKISIFVFLFGLIVLLYRVFS